MWIHNILHFFRGLERETHFACEICHAMPKGKLSRPWRVIWWIELLSGMPTPRISLISITSHLFVESYNANLAWVTTNSIIEIGIFKIKHTKWMLFLSLNLMLDNKLRKSLGDPQKSSKIFVNLQRSSVQPIGEQSDRWPLFLVFKGVPGCIEGIPGYYGMFWGVPGVFRGVPGVFRSVPGCSGFYRHPQIKALMSSWNTTPDL